MTMIVSPTGIPLVIEPSTKPKNETVTSPTFFFQLPLPGQEGVIELRGEIKAGKIIPTQHVAKLKKKGFKLPPVLEKLVSWLKKAWHGIEAASSKLAQVIGCPIKYLGLALLVAGAIHIFVVIFTMPASAIAAGGLAVLITALVTKGAVPTMLAGGSLYFFGSALIKKESPPLHNFLNGFPIISYFMNQIPSNYNPTDPHHHP